MRLFMMERLGERFGLALTPSLTLTPLAEPRVADGAILALGASSSMI